MDRARRSDRAGDADVDAEWAEWADPGGGGLLLLLVLREEDGRPEDEARMRLKDPSRSALAAAVEEDAAAPAGEEPRSMDSMAERYRVANSEELPLPEASREDDAAAPTEASAWVSRSSKEETPPDDEEVRERFAREGGDASLDAAAEAERDRPKPLRCADESEARER